MTDAGKQAAVELKPCPFCGAEATVFSAMGEHWAHCVSCDSSGHASGSRDKAIATWNRRAASGNDKLTGYAGVKDAEVNNPGGEPEDWRPVDAEEAARLRSVIYRLLERHDASPEVLSIAGSLFDTLPVSDCIDIAEDWLSSGEIMSEEQ